ncbi:hypothetical protein [uncultured Rhodospira sp.]|uniref:hypothetical protein n=1 Tax=uncultured Rhodospira sp. TaxID=1936189 RepID=UPI00261430A3|nr:hypothetical protein [uncultured Rhodospira sp.]
MRILSCVAPVGPGAQGFAPEPGDDIFAAYRAYAKQIAERWRADPDLDPLSRILIAALDLLAGHIDAANEILDELPTAPIKLDHGAGYCLVAPFVVLAAVLPWPDALKNTATWIRGSETEQALRDWLEAHRNRLAWDDEAGTYRLIGA